MRWYWWILIGIVVCSIVMALVLAQIASRTEQAREDEEQARYLEESNRRKVKK